MRRNSYLLVSKINLKCCWYIKALNNLDLVYKASNLYLKAQVLPYVLKVIFKNSFLSATSLGVQEGWPGNQLVCGDSSLALPQIWIWSSHCVLGQNPIGITKHRRAVRKCMCVVFFFLPPTASCFNCAIIMQRAVERTWKMPVWSPLRMTSIAFCPGYFKHLFVYCLGFLRL